jgi:hypothetical protein
VQLESCVARIDVFGGYGEGYKIEALYLVYGYDGKRGKKLSKRRNYFMF